jgi:hypothetical protein
MRVQTIVRTLYKFDELSDKAQQKALETLYDINVDFEWWDFIEEDAKNIGLKITEFDTYRGTIEGTLLQSPLFTINQIIKDHGELCGTYKLAKQFEQAFTEFDKSASLDDEDEGERFDQYAYSDAKEKFQHALLEEYLSILRKEYDYRTSREAIIETININDYEFEENGKLA